MITGIAAKLKDRRVDKWLVQNGYELTDCEVFYSPIQVWLFYTALALTVTIPFWSSIFDFIYDYPICFLLYGVVGYVWMAYLNHSFVIVPGQLLVINPNFPFRKVVKYDLKDLELVVMDSSLRITLLTIPFVLLGSNYLEITSGAGVRRFYCTALEIDAYDENVTEKTLDDLHASLQNHGIPTDFMIDA